MKENSFDLEQSIIGVILLNGKYMEQLVIDEQFFNDPKTKKTIELLKKQYSEFHTVDIVGLTTNYPDYFSGTGGITIEFLSECLTMGTPNQFEYYQDSLFKLHIRKMLLGEIQKFQIGKINQDELLDSIHTLEQKTLYKTSNNLTGEQIYNLIIQQKKKIIFNYQKLTKAANIQENDLIVIAARPGIGKTGFAINLLTQLSDKYKCLYFNMEMTEQQLYRRMVSIISNIPMLEQDNLSKEHTADLIKIECLKEASEKISKKKIEIITGGQTIRTIRSKIIKEATTEHLIVFIDYVGLIRDTEKNRSNYERVTDITKELRQISLDYNCTIFVLAQINRNSEKEKNKEPKISDLKESGELEQSATTVLMLHDENMYKNSRERGHDIQLIIGKNRNGLTGKMQFEYVKSTQRFIEYESSKEDK